MANCSLCREIFGLKSALVQPIPPRVSTTLPPKKNSQHKARSEISQHKARSKKIPTQDTLIDSCPKNSTLILIWISISKTVHFQKINICKWRFLKMCHFWISPGTAKMKAADSDLKTRTIKQIISEWGEGALQWTKDFWVNVTRPPTNEDDKAHLPFQVAPRANKIAGLRNKIWHYDHTCLNQRKLGIAQVESAIMHSYMSRYTQTYSTVACAERKLNNETDDRGTDS